MNDRLPEDKLNELLPCLGPMAELVSISKKIDRQVLVNIAAQAGINGDEWVFSELELWVRILSKCRDRAYIRDNVVAELRDRGIPEFPAVLAYESAKPKPMIIEPKFVDFGCLQIGEGASTTLQASGEPVVETIAGKRFKITLRKSDSDKTLIKLQLISGSAGESIREEIILRGNTGEARVTITARWENEPPLLSWCPICGDKIKKKSLFSNKTTHSYECLNLGCKHEFPYADKSVKQYNDSHK